MTVYSEMKFNLDFVTYAVQDRKGMLNKYLGLWDKTRKVLNLTTFHGKLKSFDSPLGLCCNLRVFAILHSPLRKSAFTMALLLSSSSRNEPMESFRHFPFIPCGRSATVWKNYLLFSPFYQWRQRNDSKLSSFLVCTNLWNNDR